MKKILLFLVLLVLPLSSLFSETENYVIVPRFCSLTFDVSAQMHNVHGVGNRFSGTITGDPSDITSAKISVKLDPTSFNTDNEKRDKDMREKCFEVGKYPFIEFNSTSIQAEQKELKIGQPVKATIQGALKMHGLEKQISVPVTIQLTSDMLTAQGDMAVVLDEWKIARPKVVFVQLQNDVSIHFKIGAKKSTGSN
jgi:polyisoprenoid-binding protein YceI